LGRRSFQLELPTERELKLTWRALSHRADRRGRVYRTRDAAQPLTRIVALGSPLGMVENVEDLSPESDLLALVKSELAMMRSVKSTPEKMAGLRRGSPRRPLVIRNVKMCSDQCEKRAAPGHSWRRKRSKPEAMEQR